MSRVNLYRNPFTGEVESFDLTGSSLGEWLLATYGEVPKVNVYVYAGDKPSVASDITGNVIKILANDEEVYTVLEAPGVGFDPVSILINIAISLVLSAVVNSLFTPESKAIDNRTQESPNNVLSERTNRVRIMERVEDIYGTVRAIPSLMMPTYDKYIDHRRVEHGLYCVGRGYYNLMDIREADTLLSEISGATLHAYWPFTSPNSGSPILSIGSLGLIDPVLNVDRSASVESIVLKAANQINLQPTPNGYVIRGAGAAGPAPGSFEPLPATSSDIIFQRTGYRNPNIASVAEVGQSVSMDTGMFSRTVNFPAGTLTANNSTHLITSTVPGAFRGLVDGALINFGAAFPSAANQGDKTVTAHSDNAVQVSGVLVNENSTAAVDVSFFARFNGVRQIASVGDGYMTLTGDTFPVPAALMPAGMTVTILNGLTEWTNWFTLPEGSRTQVWTNVVARLGMYKDSGGGRASAAVGYEVQVERLDAALNPTGQIESYGGSLFGSTGNERAETLEHVTAWTGPARVRIRRTTPFDYGFSGVVQDEITWTDLYGVSPVSKPHFGNKTILHTVTTSTPGAAAIRQRQLNCLASRLLPTYNGATFSGVLNPDGSWNSGTLNPTDKIVDIIAAVTVDPLIGRRPITELDMAQLWATQQALDAWHLYAGRFNHTLDDDGVSYEETVDLIASAAFCKAYKQNNVVRLALDRPQANSVALFTHRNKQPKAETITRRFANDSDYDGVELSYMDAISESMETIRLPLSGTFTKLKRVEVTGVAYYEQAWLRANREYARLFNERMTIETALTVDARAVVPNSRVDIVDNTRFKSWDGDVIAQDGLVLTLSRDIEWTVGEVHSIILKKRDGTPMVFQAFEVFGAKNKVAIVVPPPEPLVVDSSPTEGVRTTFSFGPDVARLSQSWLTNEITPADNGYMRFVGVNYSDAYYAMDSAAIPARNSVLT